MAGYSNNEADYDALNKIILYYLKVDGGIKYD